MLFEDINAHVGNDAGAWKDVIGKHSDDDVIITEGTYCNSAVTTHCV